MSDTPGTDAPDSSETAEVSTGPESDTKSLDGEVSVPTQESDDTVSLLDLIAVIARRWKLIFFATFFAGMGMVLFSIYTIRMPADSPYNPLPNYFRPEAQILLADQSGSSSSIQQALNNSDLGLLAGLAGVSGGQGESSAALAQQLIRGNNLIDQVVEEFGLLETFSDSEAPLNAARTSITGSLMTDFDGGSGIMTVSYAHIDRLFATDVLQRIVALLESRFNFLTRDQSRSRTAAIELQIQQLEDDVQQARDALTSFQRQYGIFDPEVQSEQTLELITQFRQQRFDRELERDQVLALVRNEEDPQIRRIDQELARIDDLIDELETGYRTYSPITIPLEQLGPLSAEYADLQRDMLLKETVYSSFQAELISARIDSQDTTRRFQVIEAPEVPELKAGPSRATLTVIVTVTGFFLAVFLAFVLEYFTRAKLDPTEARKIGEIRDQFRFRRER